MQVRKNQLLDIIVYTVLVLYFVVEFWNHLWNSTKDIFVLITFFAIGMTSIVGFMRDKHFLSINKIINIFIYVFCYYVAIRQYEAGVGPHKYGSFTDEQYLLANIIILVFMLVYKTAYAHFSRSEIRRVKPFGIIRVDNLALIVFIAMAMFSLIYLYLTNNLISLTIKEDGAADALTSTLSRVIRFLPSSTLLLWVFAKKTDVVIADKWLQRMFIFINLTVFCIIFFPINGVMNRYLLFGTYIIIISAYFLNVQNYSSVVLIGAVLGFYFVFPAFNFFKYHNLTQLNEFALGGFDWNSIDFDAYQLLLLTIRYAQEHGFMFGLNVFSALLCFIPRSIFTGKALPSGTIITTAYNASFTNVSCPVFAEFYLAGGIIGVILGAVAFAWVMQLFDQRKDDSILYKGFYCIAIGVLISFMRGSMLPVMSIWISLSLAYVLVVFVASKIARI